MPLHVYNLSQIHLTSLFTYFTPSITSATMGNPMTCGGELTTFGDMAKQLVWKAGSRSARGTNTKNSLGAVEASDIVAAMVEVAHEVIATAAQGIQVAKPTQAAASEKTATQTTDNAALREQIITNARALFEEEARASLIDTHEAVSTLLLKSSGGWPIALIAVKVSANGPSQNYIQGDRCESDLTALQSLDRIVKKRMGKHW
ncbi:hypothetical protein B0A48_15531 [Cryoendolithus antarcticus]|uniref:Uncharacterized protein n=1 Tax=Cryoendolithus antarcticus TaxID=1507870 RepID=A0A1V8SGI9_9PEZI|nr:hypothetical protein B0A48_15531 [Cryoendolithus antarcticus]